MRKLIQMLTVSILTVFSCIVSCTSDKSAPEPDVQPEVTLGEAASVTAGSALLSGGYSGGNQTVSAAGFEYMRSGDTLWETEAAVVGTTFSATISGLADDAVYRIRAYVVTAAGKQYSGEKTFRTGAAIMQPHVTVGAAASITAGSALLSGGYSGGNQTVTGAGFEYRKSGDTQWMTETAIPSETFTATLSGLTASTEYSIRAFVVTAAGRQYSDTGTFSTSAPEVVQPTVTVGEAADITMTGARLSGEFSGGNQEVSGVGFEYCKTSESVWKTAAAFYAAAFSAVLYDLEPGASYKVRAYATTPAGNQYSAEGTFVTAAVIQPSVTVGQAASITENSASVSGGYAGGNQTVTGVGFEYRKAGDQVWTDVEAALGVAFSASLSGLSANTGYEVRAYAVTAAGRQYSDTKSFTTAETVPVQPAVEIGDASSVSAFRATLSGGYSGGNQEVTGVGFEYRKSSGQNWITASASPGAAFSVELTALEASTAYDMRAYAATAAGRQYSGTKTFTTAHAAAVAMEVRDTGVNSASLEANYSYAGNDDDISGVGFELRTDGSGDFTAHSAIKTAGQPSFSLQPSSLSAATTYNVRAYAYNGATGDKTYSPTLTFTTREEPAVVFHGATVEGSFTSGTATSGGRISIRYDNAKGTESYTVDVTSADASFPGIAGLRVDITVAGSGELSIPIPEWTPAASGTVRLNISGIPSIGFADVTVGAGVTVTLANLVFVTSADANGKDYFTGFATGSTPGGAVVRKAGGPAASYAKVKSTASYIYGTGFNTADAYWMFVIPVSEEVKGALNVKLNVKGNAYCPRHWTIEYSGDETTWRSGGVSADYDMFTSAIYYNRTFTIGEADKIAAGGTLYIRLIPSDLDTPVTSGYSVRDTGESHIIGSAQNPFVVTMKK